MSLPNVLLDPHFRAVEPLFPAATLNRLRSFANVIWARDEAAPADLVVENEADLAAIVTGWWRYGDVARFPELQAVLEVAGMFPPVELLDYDYCFRRGIRVLSCAPGFAPAVAEMALGLAISSARGIVSGDAAFRSGSEKWGHAGAVSDFQLFGKRVGFIGYGSIARKLQQLLCPFHCHIQVYDPWLTDAYLRTQQVEPVSLNRLLSTSQVLFVLAVPSKANKGLLNRARLSRIQRGALLVLVSRSHLVDFDALTEMALAGQFLAAVDVFPEEPLPLDHPIRKASGAVLSAHRAGGGAETYRLIGEMVVNDLEAILSGRPPQQMQVALPEFIRRRGKP